MSHMPPSVFPPPIKQREFRVSAFLSLAACDAACAADGGVLVVDKDVALTGDFAFASAAVRFAGGSITLGNFDLTVPAAHYDHFADPYAYLFRYTGTGVVTFGRRSWVSPCWWGADCTGASISAAKILTREAFQNAVLATDAHWGSVVTPPAGYYLLNVALPIVYRNCHWIATPGSVRIDFDASTIPLYGGSNPFGAIFGGGNPNTRARSGSANASFMGGSGAGEYLARNCQFTGALDPANVLNGNIWSGIDIVHDPTPHSGTFIGAGKQLSGLRLFAAFNLLVEDSNFIGLPNDGVNLWLCSGMMRNVRGSLCGFYGAAVDGDSTRNGATFAGWMDLLTPELTTNRIRVVDCTFEINADTGLAAGGMSFDTEVRGCNYVGNSLYDVEAVLTPGERITQWAAGVAIEQYTMMYVPGTAANAPTGMAGAVWQYTVAGTTHATTPPTGVLGTTVADGTATAKMVGYMPASGALPMKVQHTESVHEGAIPSKLYLPWLSSVAKLTPINGNGINCSTIIGVAGGNESHITARGLRARNYGFSASTRKLFEVYSNNGGVVVLDDVELDNIYVGVGAGGTAVLISLDTQTNFGGNKQGVSSNNRSDVTVRRLRTTNITASDTSGALLAVSGNIRRFLIDDVSADANGLGDLIKVAMSQTHAAVLEYGAIRRAYTAGQAGGGVFLSWVNGGSTVNGIDIEDCAFLGLNASLNTFYSAVHGSATVAVSRVDLRVTRCKASFAGLQRYPINVTGNGGPVVITAFNNEFDLGSWRCNFLGGTPALFAAAAGVSSGNTRDNGIPGQKRLYGSAVPTTGTWFAGDQNMRTNPSSGVLLDVCTVSGTFASGATMSGCNVTISNGTDNGTYTGTPPRPGELVTFASGPTGTYRVTRADSGVIYFSANVNNAASAVALSYSAPTLVSMAAP